MKTTEPSCASACAFIYTRTEDNIKVHLGSLHRSPGTSCLLQSIFLDVYRKLFILVKFFVHARWTSLSGGTAFLLNPADSPNCGFICNNIRYRHSRVSTGCVYTLWKVRKSTQLISGRQRGIYYTSSIITCSIMQDAYSAARTRTHHPFLFNTFHWIRLLPAPRTRNVRRFCEFQTSKKEIFWKFSFHQGIPS